MQTATVAPTYPVTARGQERLSFNGFTSLMARQGRPINGDREAFHQFMFPQPEHDVAWLTPQEWNDHWEHFCEAQDSKDQHDTLADARV